MSPHAERLARELTAIETFLRDETERLPALVRPVAAHVLAAGGKRFRPMLTVLFARLLGLEGDGVYPLAASLELLHSATLLHDDILDGARLRRGKTAAHLEFSRSEAILAGDALLALANRLVADYEVPRLVSVLSEAVLRTAVGEIAEIAASRELELSEEGYLEIITGKTAYLIQAATSVGAIAAGAPKDAVERAESFGLNMGIAFQLVDDALDYTSLPEVSGKPAGSDLREGKLTLPLLFFLSSLPPAERAGLLGRIKDKSLAEADVEEIVGRIRAEGHAAATRERAAAYVADAAEALSGLPGGWAADVLSDSLQYVLARQK
ncbi:Polyprenyl synthetase [Desulfovibrio sp. X2]|uniref:polyprenyl synthetase family protein n=1 Tax=Desulfovibrio sp. X2 TaxID=941449 RepID=UPI000358E9FE|nr:polyprenyl synthetase family protein [Desulfovibrio sp. X2]EPR44730.1 Polyprenyl synthetase [Desulfovibrio sp. X2]